jgi:hypothetical protein
MNAQQEALVKRLQEAGLDTRRFLKLNKEKRAFEEEWQNRLYTPEELERQSYVLWGINGKDGLVLVDADRVEMADVLRQVLPTTFEVLSPRRGLPHFYYVVKGEPVPNKTLHLHGEEEGAGEVRAQNYYLVAPGTEIRYKDLRTSEEKTGQYKIIQDRPFAVLSSADFMKIIEPYLGKDKSQKITLEHMRKGVPQGTRHAMGIRYADYLIGVPQLDYATALFEMGKWNQLCQPPMDEKDLERMVKNAVGYISTRPKLSSQQKEFVKEPVSSQPKEKQKRKEFKDSGGLESGCFEAVIVDGKPCFLMKNSENFSVVESVEVNDETFCPKEPKHVPYEPYGYYQGSVPNREELYWKVRSEFDLFIDVEPIWKDVLAACVLLTYHQEKLQTVPYLFLYGDNESGKSTVLQVLNFLSYRPMYGVSVPSADVYGYLETSDSIGCILEDEIQGIHKDLDKTKIYKSGYKKGAKVPRTLLTQNERVIKFYHTFCFKACASEQISPIKGFNERFLFISMVEGFPQKEWADITKDDLARLHELRNMLLKWRMLARNWELPDVTLGIKGRIKELWKPILQVTHGPTAYDGLFKFVDAQRTERLSTKQNTLEGHIVKVIIDICNERKDAVDFVPFKTIWDELRLDLNGKIDDRKPNVMDTSEFFDITKNKVGYRLREVLSGKTDVHREKDTEGNWVSSKVYVFDCEKLKRIAKKYGYELVTKLPSLPSSEGVKPPGSMDSEQEKNVENSVLTPQELGKVSNSVTDNLLIPCPFCKAQGTKNFFANDLDLSIHVSSCHDQPGACSE